MELPPNLEDPLANMERYGTSSNKCFQRYFTSSASDAARAARGTQSCWTMASTNRTKRPIDSLATTAAAVATSSISARAASASSTNPPSAAATKRRVVTLADDADAVLAKCRKLRDELRKKQALQNANDGDYDDDEDDSTDLEWGKKEMGKMAGKAKASATVDDDDTKKAKTQQLSLSELRNMTSANNGKKTIVEVVEMNSTEVMEGIENVAVHIAQQVLAKQGFQLAIPCR